MSEMRIEKEHVPLARMLYRAGLWMSCMDPDGGETARVREHGVIVATLERMKNDPGAKTFKPCLHVATKARHLWSDWEIDLYSFLQESKSYAKDDVAIRRGIYMMAYKVAIAYRERGFFKGLAAFVLSLVKGAETIGPVLSKEDYVAISVSEKVALNELAVALDLPDYKIP